MQKTQFKKIELSKNGGSNLEIRTPIGFHLLNGPPYWVGLLIALHRLWPKTSQLVSSCI